MLVNIHACDHNPFNVSLQFLVLPGEKERKGRVEVDQSQVSTGQSTRRRTRMVTDRTVIKEEKQADSSIALWARLPGKKKEKDKDNITI